MGPPWTDRHNRKHYLLATSLAGHNQIRDVSTADLPMYKYDIAFQLKWWNALHLLMELEPC